MAEGERGRWVEARLKELPRYCMFLYNLLLDAKLPDHYKQHAFGALNYILMGGDIIPKEDTALDGLDEVAFALRCMSELIGKLPPASLQVYEEVLHREGIPVRNHVQDVAKYLDRFFFSLDPLYRERITRYAPHYKSCVQTGVLVNLLRSWMAAWEEPRFSAEKLEQIDLFLDSFGA